MNKKEFIRQLKKELRKRNVNDIPEILTDYEEHFEAKLEEKTEEEIVLELGLISQIADEYAANRSNGSNKNGKPVAYNGKRPRVWVAVLLIGFDVVFGIAIASIIFSLVISLGAVALGFIAGGGFYTVYSFIMFGSLAVKFAGFFASLTLLALGLLAAFSIKPVIKGIITLGKQYVKLHRVLIGGRA